MEHLPLSLDRVLHREVRLLAEQVPRVRPQGIRQIHLGGYENIVICTSLDTIVKGSTSLHHLLPIFYVLLFLLQQILPIVNRVGTQSHLCHDAAYFFLSIVLLFLV